jgi:hypothetical protein
MPWERDRSWLEVAGRFALWTLLVLLLVFVSLVFYRVAHADDCLPEQALCDTGSCCAGFVCTNHRCRTGTGATTTTTTTLPDAMSGPVIVTAQDVSLKVHGGADYTVFRGHAADQYERDMMEQTLLGQWTPRVIAFMEGLPACSGAVHEAWTGLTSILAKLDVVHQYDDIAAPKTWNVTPGGRHYQIEYYIDDHAHACALSDPVACATSPLLTPDLLDLLDLSVANGMCVDGAAFEPPIRPTQAIGTLDGIADGRQRFPVTDPDDLLLVQATLDAHAGGMCGATPAGSVSAAQVAFADTAKSRAEMHYRQPQPFIGGCDPSWTADECCRWKMLEHREYTALVAAWKGGNWGTVRCFGGRHRRIHACAVLAGPYQIRMPPCDGSYPDDTKPVTCAAYLASPTP